MDYLQTNVIPFIVSHRRFRSGRPKYFFLIKVLPLIDYNFVVTGF